MTVNLPDDARELFQGKNFAHVTSLMKDGSPQASAVWCEAVGNDIVINCDETTIKVKNFRRDPRVAVSIIGQDKPYEAVFVRGRVHRDQARSRGQAHRQAGQEIPRPGRVPLPPARRGATSSGHLPRLGGFASQPPDKLLAG